ncbi:MAG TPA: LPS export ABC transporter periplasmic protein LptC [Candidatus Didemnitutus sp.]|nr:LPS export ABC transporter periplasmic protein LptC [Candidatus Didemnitutus sp.]
MSRLLTFTLAVAAIAVAPAGAQNSTRISTDAPITNFKLPVYKVPEGYRAWLIRGTEAHVKGANDIDIDELNLTVFSGDAREKIDTVILSPKAHVAPEDEIASGPAGIRIVNDEYEAGGVGWRYDHKAKKVSIDHNVKVILHGELKGFLK